MPVLQVLSGEHTQPEIELSGGRVLLGRHPDCRIILADAAVSRHHAQIVQDANGCFVEDLGSRNGTHVNGERIRRPALLHEGDEIAVCDVVFRFHESASPRSYSRSDRVAGVECDAQSPAGPRSGTQLQEISPAPALGDHSASGEGAHVLDEDSDTSSIVMALNAGSSVFRPGTSTEAKLRAVLGISNSLGEVLDLDEILRRVLDGLFELFPSADSAFVLMPEPASGELALRATRTRRSRRVKPVPVSNTVVRRAVERGEAILSSDASQDERFRGSKSLLRMSLRAMMCVPLVGKSGQTRGVIQIACEKPGASFVEDDLELLVSVASQANLAIDNAHMHEAILRQRELQRELEFATEVQRSFLPHSRPELRGYQFCEHYQAAESVGGDYFDYVQMPDGRVAVSLADVAGKGVPAALLMAKLCASARYQLLTKPTLTDVLSELNAEVDMGDGAGHRFITFVVAIIDPHEHVVTIGNAGHLPPLRRDVSGRVEPIGRRESGMPLGIVADQQFHEIQCPLEPGDTWLLLTDGITEAQNGNRQMYGRQRLQRLMQEHGSSIESLVARIVDDVQQFSAGSVLTDDICLVGFQRGL